MRECAFLTGSYAYGTPHAGSDVDLVVLVDDVELAKLRALADVPLAADLAPEPPKKASAAGTRDDPGDSLRFGRLNLIAHTDERVFGAWRSATRALEARKPVQRADAVETIKRFVSVALRDHTSVEL